MPFGVTACCLLSVNLLKISFFICTHPVVSEQDFVVNYKGKVVSFKALLQEILKNNVKLPVNTQDFLNAVIGQKNSSDQSCQGRCSKEERSGNATKSCYCDKDCKAWGDCCLDFPTR